MIKNAIHPSSGAPNSACPNISATLHSASPRELGDALTAGDVRVEGRKVGFVDEERAALEADGVDWTDIEAVRYVLASLAGTDTPERLRRFVVCYAKCAERIEWWHVECLADTFQAICRMYTLSPEEKSELVEFLWAERCTLLDEKLSFDFQALAQRPEIIKASRCIFDALIVKITMVRDH